MTREIEEKATNYMKGRAMALSFKPLSLADIKEAYLCGAEDYANASEPVNPWHKVADEDLPKEGQHILMARKMRNGDYLTESIWYSEPNITDNMEYWMPIPEIKED